MLWLVQQFFLESPLSIRAILCQGRINLEGNVFLEEDLVVLHRLSLLLSTINAVWRGGISFKRSLVSNSGQCLRDCESQAFIFSKNKMLLPLLVLVFPCFSLRITPPTRITPLITTLTRITPPMEKTTLAAPLTMTTAREHCQTTLCTEEGLFPEGGLQTHCR